jgi:phosphatidylinositol phospholipase C gamma-1
MPPPEELHLSEIWYHGEISRNEATAMLNRNKHLGNGTFLVRKSENFVGDYTLQFL